MNEIGEYIIFLKNYFLARLMSGGLVFEGIKDIIVAFLIVKRGKYSSSFLNTSFLMIVAAAIVGGPIIAENAPFFQTLNNQNNYQALVVSYNPYGGSLSTVFSVKPRDKVENYTVRGGENLALIAKKFDISVDTIKWANDLKTDVIKPGQVLKIAPVTGIVHKVVSGDTIYTIAKKYNTNAQNILNFPFNSFEDLDTFSLAVGQTLFVPGGTIEPEKPAAGYFVASIQAGVKGSSSFIWPTSGVITQYPIWYHMALDIANPTQPPVIAADGGTVIYSGWNSTGYGNMVMIDHGNGYRSLYGHLSSILVSAGQVVNKGQQVGVMGSTGRSTGTHLHFEIRSGETLLNPMNFLK